MKKKLLLSLVLILSVVGQVSAIGTFYTGPRPPPTLMEQIFELPGSVPLPWLWVLLSIVGLFEWILIGYYKRKDLVSWPRLMVWISLVSFWTFGAGFVSAWMVNYSGITKFVRGNLGLFAEIMVMMSIAVIIGLLSILMGFLIGKYFGSRSKVEYSSAIFNTVLTIVGQILLGVGVYWWARDNILIRSSYTTGYVMATVAIVSLAWTEWLMFVRMVDLKPGRVYANRIGEGMLFWLIWLANLAKVWWIVWFLSNFFGLD